MTTRLNRADFLFLDFALFEPIRHPDLRDGDESAMKAQNQADFK